MKRALFLDRDGIINRMVLYDHGWDSPQKQADVKLNKDIEKIISWANKNSIFVIEITNQPGVAKGRMNQKNADRIESQIHKLLTDQKVKVDKIYTCPHHPKGIVPELTMECNCRKPMPGLILLASSELNIDLSKSVLIGDSDSDIEAGKLAGCKTLLYFHNQNIADKIKLAKNCKPDYKVTNLNKALLILKEFFTT